MIARRLKNTFRHYMMLCMDRDYRILHFSHLFDPHYYRKHYPDIDEPGSSPLLHYLQFGGIEGRRPSLVFDALYYLRQYPEVAESGENPLLHFLKTGWREKKNPNIYFDSEFYLSQYKDSISEKEDPLTNYLQKGWRSGYFPAEVFQQGSWHNLYMKELDAGNNPLHHLLSQQERERTTPPSYFDAGWYKDRFPGLLDDTTALWHHYYDYGRFEGKAPLPVFDPAYYVDDTSKSMERAGDIYADFCNSEKNSTRRPAEWFDPAYYRTNYMAELGDDLSTLEHYLKHGVFNSAYTDSRIAELPQKPLISILVPVYNAKPHHLNNSIRSVLYQAYPHWELCLCDDCSTEPHIAPLLAKWAAVDPRIKVAHSQKNEGISGATNTAATLATGDYLGFLDNDDELASHCLYKVAKTIGETGAEWLYTDEDLIGEDGRRFTPFYKPEYNAELLLCHNYITHFVACSRTLFEQVGGCRSEMDGAQDFDLVLRLSEAAKSQAHIPEILYHWRASETSTSINHEQKSYADDAGKTALQQAMTRRGIAAKVLETDWKFYYRCKREPAGNPDVTIVVYLEDTDSQALQLLTEHFSQLEYPDCNVLLICPATTEDDRESCRRVFADAGRYALFFPDSHLNRSAIYNAALEQVTAEYVVFFSSTIQPRNSDWLECLLEYGQNMETGLVGGRLYDDDEDTKLSTVPDIESDSAYYYSRFLYSSSIHLNGLQWAQEVVSVPAELFLVRKELLVEIGGFNDEHYPHLFSIADLAFRLREKGYKSIYMPYCEADYNIAGMVEDEDTNRVEWQAEKCHFQGQWQDILKAGNPYYNRGCYRQEGISDEAFNAWYAGEG